MDETGLHQDTSLETAKHWEQRFDKFSEKEKQKLWLYLKYQELEAYRTSQHKKLESNEVILSKFRRKIIANL